MRDFKLTNDPASTEWDLDVTGGKLHMVEGVDCLVQRLKIKCQHIVGEWYLDTAAGAVNFSLLGMKNPDLGLVSSLIRDTIQNDPEIREITSFSLNYAANTRKLNVNFEANSTYGPVTVAV